MVISLYICEIPRNVNKGDIEELFKPMDGYLATRIKGPNEMRKIAFVDFKEEDEAIFAMKTYNGFKFSPSDRGLVIKVSDNSYGGGASKPGRKDSNRYSRGDKEDRHRRHRKDEDSGSERSRSRSRSRNRSPSVEYNNEKSNSINQNNQNNQSNQAPGNTNNNNGGNLLDLLTLLNQGQPQPNNTSNNPTTNKPYTMNTVPEGAPDTSANAITNLLDVLQNLQTVQLLSNSLNPPAKETPNNPIIPSQSTSTPEFYSSLLKFDDSFRKTMDFKRNATSIVYVEGLPYDTTEREVAHIFRPFPGFKSVRLISRDKNGQKSLICFADFENIVQSTLCINTLQGYRFDKNDLIGLHFSYGVTKHKDKK